MLNSRPKIGLITLYFDLYNYAGDSLLKSSALFADELVANMQTAADVVFPGVCINRADVDAAVERFEKEDVELIVLVFLTYTPSMYALPALLRTQKPVLLFCTQKLPAVTQAVTTLDTDQNHGVHGFQDMASVLHRTGRPYHFMAGYWNTPATQAELHGWFQAAHIRQVLHHATIGLIGHAMENMGDFGVDETAFQAQMGLHVHHMSMMELAKTASTAPAEEIRGMMKADRAAFQVLPMVTDAQHEAASRLEWALRKLVKEKNLAGFAAHFMSASEEGWMDSLPFLAATKLLGEGYSFGGEGDVTSAAAVTILQLLAGEANFTEMFTIDFGGGTVLMSHMGEGNWKMARPGAPIQMRSDDFGMVPLRQNPVSLVFTLRPSPATLLNITTGPGGKLQWIIVQGEVVDIEPLPNLTLVHNKFKPNMPVEEFLTRYGTLGGSHHQALAYGDHTASLVKLAKLMDIPVNII